MLSVTVPLIVAVKQPLIVVEYQHFCDRGMHNYCINQYVRHVLIIQIYNSYTTFSVAVCHKA